MNLKVHHDSFKPANLSRGESNVNLVVHLKERLEAPYDHILK